VSFKNRGKHEAKQNFFNRVNVGVALKKLIKSKCFIMGGGMFLNTARLSTCEYARMCRKVKQFLKSQGLAKVGIPPQVLDKEDIVREFKGPEVLPYGDVDCIVATENERGIEAITKKLAVELNGPIRRHGRLRSIKSEEGYQVDLRFCFDKEFDFLLGMSGNNDFSGLLGHVLYPFRLKWCPKGLMLKTKVEKESYGVTTFKRVDLLLTNDR